MFVVGSGMLGSFLAMMPTTNMDKTLIWAAGGVDFPEGCKGHPLGEQKMVPVPWWLLKDTRARTEKVLVGGQNGNKTSLRG